MGLDENFDHLQANVPASHSHLPTPHRGAMFMIGRFLIVPIRIYQICLAPLLGPRCRFYPSCSRYAVACLEKDPLSVALKKISCRILRCHPWHPGGVDLP